MNQDVEMATSVDDVKCSRSIQGITHVRDFELLDARIASSRNKIIPNSCFKKKVSLEEQKCSESRLSRKTDRLLRLLQSRWCHRFCTRLCRLIPLFFLRMIIIRIF